MSQRKISLIVDSANGLSCDDQFEIAKRVAANVGYTLAPGTSIQEAEDGKGMTNTFHRILTGQVITPRQLFWAAMFVLAWFAMDAFWFFGTVMKWF